MLFRALFLFVFFFNTKKFARGSLFDRAFEYTRLISQSFCSRFVRDTLSKRILPLSRCFFAVTDFLDANKFLVIQKRHQRSWERVETDRKENERTKVRKKSRLEFKIRYCKVMTKLEYIVDSMHVQTRTKREFAKNRHDKQSMYTDKELWSFLSTSIEKKKANKRKRDPDMLRNAVLELTVQRLNEEITERCMNKVKRKKIDDSYEWQGPLNGLGWNMTASYQDDEDLLGIGAFFQKIRSCQSRNSACEEMVSMH